YVATKRHNGSLSKVVPVWFMYDGDAIYFATLPTSYKAKRLKKGGSLYVWVGAADGPHFVGPAELITDPAVAARMAPVYAQKYWIAWLGLFKPNPERARSDGGRCRPARADAHKNACRPLRGSLEPASATRARRRRRRSRRRSCGH